MNPALIRFLLRYLPHILLASSIVGCTVLLRLHWIKVGEDRVTAEWNAEKLAASEAHTKQLQEVRDAERAEVSRQTAIATDLTEKNAHAEQEIDRLNADIRAGNIRLRKRFTCPRMPDQAAAASGSDAAEEGGLRGTDADLLIRIARDADRAVNQLAACQAILAGDG